MSKIKDRLRDALRRATPEQGPVKEGVADATPVEVEPEMIEALVAAIEVAKDEMDISYLVDLIGLYDVLTHPSKPEAEAVEQMEGVAFLDGDHFCSESSCKTGQRSWTFVPTCEHEAGDQTTNEDDFRATLIIHRTILGTEGGGG